MVPRDPSRECRPYGATSARGTLHPWDDCNVQDGEAAPQLLQSTATPTKKPSRPLIWKALYQWWVG